MDKTKYSHFESLKTATQTTLSIRRRIERFNNREEGDEGEEFELDLLERHMSAVIRLSADRNHEGTVDLSPIIYIDRRVNKCTFTLWLENLAGEKFSKMTCEFKLMRFFYFKFS
jgi:hypothetical protein